MAEKIPSHLSYCAGTGWIGDGNSATSPCPFKHSMHIEALRYVCHHCALGIKPSGILADEKGIHLQNIQNMHDEEFKPKTVELDESGNTIKRRGRKKGRKHKSKS